MGRSRRPDVPGPNIHVGFVQRLDRPNRNAPAASQSAAGPATVYLQGGGAFHLDPSDPRSAVWEDLLEELHQEGSPVYLDIDPQRNAVRELLLPQEWGVSKVGPVAADGTVPVELFPSAARHFVRASNPAFARIVSELRTARRQGTPVLVTDALDEPEIIDARAPPPPLGGGLAPVAAAAPALHECGLSTATAVTPAQAQQMFALVQGASCLPAPAPPCIPFPYPDDGCWVRAHEMCRLMADAGAVSCKVWLYGSLRVATRNSPKCQVLWTYHVAPLLLVDQSEATPLQVIDPALFNGPVGEADWVNVQNDSNAALVRTDAAVYVRSPGGAVGYDPNYVDTDKQLRKFRRLLRARANSSGPPPYAHCP
jgi:hypothetical protein